MKTKIKRGVMLIALAIMSCLVFGLVACTKPEPSEPVLSGISITNKTELTAEWHAGDADRTIVVALSPESFTSDNTEITVTSSGEAVTVDTDDKFKLHAVADGKATVTVAAGDFTDSVEITVTAVGVSFADSNKVTLAVGEKSTRKASVTPDTYNAVYSVKDGSTDVITVDTATGEVTANAVGKAVVVATVQGGATAEYEVEVIAALSSITVTNAATFDNDINYGTDDIELDIMLDNGYTFNSAEISVIASDTDYVSVINTDGKYYAVINKITYGTDKSDGVTIEIKSDRFKNVPTVTLNVKVAATAPVLELESQADIQAFAGDIVELPAINKSKKCDGDVAPTVTIKKGETEVAGAYNAQDNTLTIDDQGDDYTVTYSLTDDRAASPLTTSKTINVKLYRKVFKAVTGKKVYDYPDTVLDFDYGANAKFVADANQTVSIQESDTVLGQFNMTASKYYYAEAVFTLKNPSDSSFVGLSHSLPVDSGTPTRWLAAMVDRGDRNFKIKDIDMTDETGKENNNPDCFNHDKDVLYRHQLVGYGGLTDSNEKEVKFAVARVGEYFYTFLNDQLVMVNTDKDYSAPTVPGIFGIKLSDSEAGVTIGGILWIVGQDATNTKLNELYTDKYFGYHKWKKGPSFVETDNGFTTSNDVETSEDGGANGCYMSSGITPYVVFDGDFKVEYDYTNTEAKFDAVRWTRGALLNIVSALSHTELGQQQVMASVGVRITVNNATSGNNVVYHGSPAMQESGVPFEAKDVNLSGSGENQANFTDSSNYTSEKPYTTLAVHNNESIHFSVERRLKDDHAEYTMKITVNGNTVTRVMQVRCDRWSDPVMFMWGNQSNHGTVSNIAYQPIEA